MEKSGISDREKAELRWLLQGFMDRGMRDRATRVAREMLIRDLNDEWQFANANPHLVEVVHI